MIQVLIIGLGVHDRAVARIALDVRRCRVACEPRRRMVARAKAAAISEWLSREFLLCSSPDFLLPDIVSCLRMMT
jgi:hypothetical protein